MRKRYTAPAKKNNSFTLNITSMTDMFTLLLVFLLQTYSTAEVQVDPEKDLRLPSSVIDNNLVNGVKISINNQFLKMGNIEIAKINNLDIDSGSIDKSDPQFIRPLFAELDKLAKTKGHEKHIRDGLILLQADRELPYLTLRKVMYTASMAGFSQVKLITLTGNK